jgi:HAD superfamily hydrolase (TIGR01458 family)
MKKSQPFLIDFDGVIKLGDKPAPDAKEFFDFIQKKNIPAFVISNSTLRTSQDIKEFFENNNIEFNIPAMTAAEVTLSYVKENYKRVKVYCTENIKKLFKDFIVKDNPEVVVVGDLADKWSYEILNEIFRDVFAGADLIAMQKNKFWKPDGKTLCLDAGSFITAIEYATGKQATLIGKPSSIYFRTALKLLGLNEEQSFLMLGDDLETDIIAAQNIGGKGILIFTGKTKYPLPEDMETKPDFEVKNLIDVIRILDKIY